MIETRKREHSRKPDEQYDLIEACSPGPFLEMFARYPREAGRAWGTEADDDITPRDATTPRTDSAGSADFMTLRVPSKVPVEGRKDLVRSTRSTTLTER